jgi:hypothetical protein
MMKARPRCLGTRGEREVWGRGGGDIGNNRKLCGFGFCSFGELGEKVCLVFTRKGTLNPKPYYIYIGVKFVFWVW